MFPSKEAYKGLIIAVVLSLLILTPAGSFGQELARISFSGAISEELEDPDDDGLSDHLVLVLKIKVFEPGSYGVYGSMGNGIVNANWGPEDLTLGETEIRLKFSGGQISQYGRKGKFDIQLEAYSKDLQMDPITLDYTTDASYDSDLFEAPQGATETFVYARGDKVFIQGNMMTVSVNQTYPELSFSYTGNYASSVSKSSILYERLIAFEDEDDDGIWDQDVDSRIYEGDLTTVDWELDLDISVGYDISLTGILQMRRVDTATVAGWARITFRLGSDLLQSSGNIQKFDIDIELWQPLDGERLALMHRLSDETGEQTITAGTGDSPYSGDPFNLHMLGEGEEVYGTYSWGEEIDVGLLEPDTRTNATTWYEVNGDRAEIWFSYPMDDDIQFIHHDPKLGMDPDHLPVRQNEEDSLNNNLWIMLLGILAGIVLVGITIFIQVRGKGPGGGA